MPVEELELKSKGDKLTVTLTGEPEELMRALVHGLPREVLKQFFLELQKRASA